MTSGLVSRKNIVSSMYACMNAPGMSHVVTYLFSLVSMKKDGKMDSVVTEGDILPFFVL